MKNLKGIANLRIILLLTVLVLIQYTSSEQEKIKPKILITTDIGGTDPDDNQSMIHLLMYADLFEIEGLVSSPYGEGKKENILEMIDFYEKDYSHLKGHSSGFPDPNSLREICKQGAIDNAPFKGYSTSTEGSEWIIRCAKKKSDKTLWILVWGGIEDVAQALHDAPEIKKNIKVYWIGGPNKKWSVNAYAYIAENHPDLWMIEANATYRGWFMDSQSQQNITDGAYYSNFIQGRGAMGKDFKNYYEGNIKMGDTPSLAYLMDGNPNDPSGESWGGNFTTINHSSRSIFNGNSTVLDTVVAYGIQEWIFEGPELNISEDSICFSFEINRQKWPGFYLGSGKYGIRYSSKKPETGTYVTSSNITELDGQKGQFVSITPWPGKPGSDDYKLGNKWYSDRQEPEFFMEEQQGAKTVSKYREEFLMDWAKRWEWLQ